MTVHLLHLLLSLALSAAQVQTQNLYNIAGKVLDGKNRPVPGASVRLLTKEPGPPSETLTDTDGSFSFANLPEGSYQIVVEMAGFAKLTQDGINPTTESSRQLTLVLERPKVGPDVSRASKQTAPPRTAENGQRFRAMSQEGSLRGDSLPALPPLNPGDETPNTPAREDNSDLLLISGNPTANIGAGDWNDPQFRERMMEMAGRMGFGGLEGGGFGGREGEGFAFTGRGGGGEGGGFGMGHGGGGREGFGGFGGGRGGRGGRQPRLNGSVFSTYRNSVFNARPYSITGAEVSKPLQIQNNFGASLGGPVPWGAKTTTRGFAQQPGMWFFSFEGSRNRNPYDILTTVPSVLERSGDFSQTSLRSGPLAGRSVTLYDPSAVGTLFPRGQIPTSRMNSAALALLKYIPEPNLPGSVQNFTMPRGLINISNSFSARLNTRLSPKDNAFFSYSLRTGDSISSQIFPGLDTNRTNRSQNASIGGMHRFQPRFILNYRVNFNRVRTLSSNPFAFKDDVAGKLGIQGVSRDPINFGIPTLSFTNYGDLQLGNPSLNRSQTLTVGSGANKIGNKHSIQVGGDISWNQRNSQVDPNARGTYDFTGFATSAFDQKGKPLAGTGYDLADFLLGLPYSTSRRYGSSNNYLRNKSFNIFVQDNWRVRSNLTVNVGLRYEFIQPFYEKYNHIVSLDVAPGFSAVGQVFPAGIGPYTGQFPRSLLFADKNNFGPRIGIAWKPKANSPWVFRTGYGLFYNPSVYPSVYGQLVGQPPFATSQNILTTLSSPLTLQNGFSTEPSVTILNSYAIDPHYRIGYVQQWNFNIQRQIRRVYTLEAGYNATKGTRLDILRAPNRAPTGISPGQTEDNRIISNAGNFVYQSSGANSILHSLRVRVNRRFSHGFRVENSYTLGKSIDNASGLGGGSLLVVQDDRNIRAERSRSGFDQRHRLESEFNIELPFGERRKFLASAPPVIQGLVGGWNINGEYQFNSGTAQTARLLGNVSNNSGTGSNASERPDATGAPVSLPGDERTTGHYFNTLAFAIPAPGRFGNAGRYTIPGPGSNVVNLSLRKNFRLDDNNRRLEFRCQVSNVLNHPNFGGLGAIVNSLTFGRVTSARSMRQVEFNLRLNF